MVTPDHIEFEQGSPQIIRHLKTPFLSNVQDFLKLMLMLQDVHWMMMSFTSWRVGCRSEWMWASGVCTTESLCGRTPWNFVVDYVVVIIPKGMLEQSTILHPVMILHASRPQVRTPWERLSVRYWVCSSFDLQSVIFLGGHCPCRTACSILESAVRISETDFEILPKRMHLHS